MREYATWRPRAWTRGTFRSLSAMAKLVALNLSTSPHSNMIGLFYVTPAMVADEIGAPLEGALGALRELVSKGFIRYDFDANQVWVCSMAREQVAEELDSKDGRIRVIEKMLNSSTESPFVQDFLDTYAEPFNLGKYTHPKAKKRRKAKAPSNPPSDGARTPPGTPSLISDPCSLISVREERVEKLGTSARTPAHVREAGAKLVRLDLATQQDVDLAEREAIASEHEFADWGDA